MGWLGAAALGVTNGVVRQALYQERVGAKPAHYLSTAGLTLLLGGYIRLLARRWPIRRPRQAMLIGGAWSVMTILFEFGFGRGVARESWAKLLEQYNVRRGYVWVVIPIWMTVGPRILGMAHEGGVTPLRSGTTDSHQPRPANGRYGRGGWSRSG